MKNSITFCIISCMFSLIPLSSNAQSQQNPPPVSPQVSIDLNNPLILSGQCEVAFNQGDYKKVELLANQFQKEKQIKYKGKNYVYHVYDLDVNGNYKVQNCYNGLMIDLEHAPLNSDITKRLLQNVKDYEKAFPKSELALTLDAAFQREMAWKIRGGDTVDKVNPQNYILYNAFIQSSINTLDSSKELFHIPFWYDMRISMESTQQNRNFNVAQELFEQSVTLYPDYMPSYTGLANGLKPQWGGSWDLVDGIGKLAYKINDKLNHNKEFYAKYYANTSCCSKFNGLNYDEKLFDSSADELIKKYPTNYNYNKLAKAACALSDTKKLVQYMTKMNPVDWRVWDNENFYSSCLEEAKDYASGHPN
jgi:hypothetical protein